MVSRPRDSLESSQDHQNYKEMVRAIFKPIEIVSGSRGSFPSPSTSSWDCRNYFEMVSRRRDPPQFSQDHQNYKEVVRITSRSIEIVSGSRELSLCPLILFWDHKNYFDMISGPKDLQKSFQDRQNYKEMVRIISRSVGIVSRSKESSPSPSISS